MKSFINVLLLLVCLVFVISCGLGGEKETNSTADGGGAESGVNDNSNAEFAVEGDDSGIKPDASAPGNKSITVKFDKGATSKGYDESISAGGNHVYSLSASKGQSMTVKITSPDNNAAFNVLDPVGNKLNDGDAGSTVFTRSLPSNGKYKILVSGSKGAANYKINFSVSGKSEDDDLPVEDEEDDEPGGGLTKTVKFSKGSSSASYSDAVIRGERNTYILGANAGQTMNVSISSVESNAVFQIKGPTGYLPGTAPGTDARSWSGQLPANGKYNIIVGGTRGNATYTVKFSIK